MPESHRPADAGPAEAPIRALEDDLVGLALRRASLAEIVDRTGWALTRAGLRLDLVRLAARTLHPSIDAIGAAWTAAEGLDTTVWRHSDSRRDTWLRSPLFHMLETGTVHLRRRLVDPSEPRDYAVFEDLAAEGFTDYVARLVGFGDAGPARREGVIMRWMSRHPDGFREADLAVLERVAPRLAAAVMPGLERSIARNLLEAYVGTRSGAQVLEGGIQPGEAKAIEAVILVADLAGFTAAGDAVPGDRLVGLLERHFEAMVPPVTTRGGEILAFLGDGFLAVFELDGDAGRAASAALDAAVAATKGVAALAPALAADGLPALPLEVALHVGTVRYGNVGAGGRQAFTVIGPAVNAATRIEALCRPLGHPILASHAFAAAAADPRLVPVGAHPLRGVAEPMPLFAWS